MTKQQSFLLSAVALVLVGVFGMNYYQQQSTNIAGQLMPTGFQKSPAMMQQPTDSAQPVATDQALVVEQPGDSLDPNEVVAIVQNEDGTTTEYTRAQLDGVTLVDDVWQDPGTADTADTGVQEPGDTTMPISDIICTNVVAKPPTRVKFASGQVLPKEYVKTTTTTTTTKNPKPPPPTVTKTTTKKEKAMVAARCTQKRAETAAKEVARADFINACEKAAKKPGACPEGCMDMSVFYKPTNELVYVVKSNRVKKYNPVMDCANNKEDAGGVDGQAWEATATIADQDCTVTRVCTDRKY